MGGISDRHQEIARRRHLAKLGDVADPQHRDKAGILHHRNEVIPKGRQDRAEGLGKDDVAEPLPAVQAQRLGGLDPVRRLEGLMRCQRPIQASAAPARSRVGRPYSRSSRYKP